MAPYPTAWWSALRVWTANIRSEGYRAQGWPTSSVRRSSRHGSSLSSYWTWRLSEPSRTWCRCGTNRTIVAAGLKRMRVTERCGLRALFTVAKVDTRYLDSAAIGYYLGPRINAANRLADPRLAFDLLTATDPAEAHRLAARLDEHNSSRQEQVKTAISEATETLGRPAMVKAAIREGSRHPLITVRGEWGPGISGLLASDLTDRYGVPAFAAARREDGLATASARSVAGVNVLEIQNAAMDAQPGVFLGGGGHSQACGFTTSAEMLEAAFEALGGAARGRVPTENLESRIVVDAQIHLRQVDIRSLELVRAWDPMEGLR